ncbi:CHAT domain-containing protein, partial [Phormidium sp. CCY1219]|uniref:CHAT domain-containing protein n=1 Tax=Phormidium sp. CCY1219 TaxID=2886104 RepID=UPI002D1E93BF
LGQYEEAIASYNEAIRLQPDFAVAYNNRGIAQRNLGQHEEAIASYNEAIRLQPDYAVAYFNRGNAQDNLGQYEEAIASFDCALTWKRDLWQAWTNRGNAAGKVQTRNSPYLPSALAIQNSNLNQRGFEGKLASYEEGLKYCQQDTHPEGWGMLHYCIGNAYYSRSRLDARRRRQDWHAAFTHYNRALETLTETAYPETHLEVLRQLIGVLLGLEETEQAQELQRRGADLLRRLVEDCAGSGKQRQLALKFADFNQLTVDLWVRRGDVVRGLEVAEAGKNACLSWLFWGRSEAVREPDWQQIRQLVRREMPPNSLGKGGFITSTTAAVYWHLSPYALRTFILKPDAPFPTVLGESRFREGSGYMGNLPELEEWSAQWNRQYRRDKGSKLSALAADWRGSLPQQLDRLGEILQIEAILAELEDCQGCDRLLLFPHKDLHRFPLHALFLNCDRFPRTCAIAYLPSAAFGLGLWASSPGEETGEMPSVLSLQNPDSQITDTEGTRKSLEPLPAADMESHIISRRFARVTRLAEKQVTAEAVKSALRQSHAGMHFTGHGYYEFTDPLASALCLSGCDRLTVRDILQLNLSGYRLISLSACETAVSGNPTITSEYVGLSSGFLRSGVSAVLSTLWQVQSDASTLFFLYFYQQLHQEYPTPVAFTAAQHWLKTVTREDLAQWYRQLIAELSQTPHPRDADWACIDYLEACAENLATIEKNPPYADPYHWATFTLYGR